MAVFRVERNKGYTVMSNHHLRNKELSLKAKGLVVANAVTSRRLGLHPCRGCPLSTGRSIDAIRTAVWELEKPDISQGGRDATRKDQNDRY